MSSDVSSNASNKEHADPLWVHDGRCQVRRRCSGRCQVIAELYGKKNVTYKHLNTLEDDKKYLKYMS